MSSDGGATVYFGKRVSQNFGRVYDKGVEHQGSEPGRWWRWEVEVKSRLAFHVANSIAESDRPKAAMRSFVSSWYDDRAPFTFTADTVDVVSNGIAKATTKERQLEWLARGVRPTVAKLVEWYGRERVLCALGLLVQSDGDSASIAATLKPEQRCQRQASFTELPISSPR